jgi:ATP-binding cassette, subfamily B, multidrug efflux pump
MFIAARKASRGFRLAFFLNMKNLKRLIGLLMLYPGRTLVGLAAIVVSDCVQLSFPWVTKFVVDGLEAGTMTRNLLLSWGAALLALAALSFGAKQVWRHLILGAARRIEYRLRETLLEKTLSLTMKKSKETESGKFMSLASNDIPAVGQALAFGVVAFFDSIFVTVVAFALMHALSPQLTAYILIPFPILTVLMLLSLKLIYKRWDTAQQSLEDLTEKTRESLSGIRTLRAYNQSQGDIDSFQQRNRHYREKVLSYVRIDATFQPLILLFAGSSSGILLYFGGGLVIEQQITVGTLAAFVGYLSLLTWPMIAAGWMLVLLQRGSASINRLDKILNSDSEFEDRPRISKATSLEVRNLSFDYGGDERGLQNWNITLEPGSTLGIVGPVGGGKSTFFKLLLLLESPPPGAIYLDGQDITEFSPSSVRSQFAYVSQEPFLFSDTIRNNLLMSHPGADEHELATAVERASLTDDLAEFPDGLDTLLGERGISLSGGQRQRTALARAFLKPAPFMLLDDTLSAVDTVTESRILSHLRTRQERHTHGVVIVSHRLSAVAKADEILVVDEGTIVDRGTHESLSSREGIYRDLLAHQSEGEIEPLV